MRAAVFRLLFVVGVACAGWFGVSRLDFDVDPLSLLPQELPGLEGTRLLRDSKQNQLIVVLTSTDAEALEEKADGLATFLRGHPELTDGVQHRPLLESDLETLARGVASIWRNAPPQKVAALAASVQGEALTELIQESQALAAGGLDPQTAGLAGYDPLGLARGALALLAGEMGQDDQLSLPGDAYGSADGTLRLLYLNPPASALKDYRTVSAWLAELKRAVREEWMAKLETRPAELQVGFTGDPAFQAEIATGMEADMRQSISVVTFLVGFLFWLLHRRILPLLWLLLAILCANLLTLGAAGLIYGSLNVMSMGFAAILTGLIEDFGVIGLYKASQHPGENYGQILRRTWPAVAWSAVTIAGIFASLGMSQLPGISQLGQLAAVGVLVGAGVMLLGFLPLGMRGGPVVEAAGAGDLALRFQRLGTGVLVLALLGAALVLGIRGWPRADFGSAVLRPAVSEAFDVSEKIERQMLPASPEGTTLPVMVTAANERALRERLTKAEATLRSEAVTRYMLPTALVVNEEAHSFNAPTLEGLAKRAEELRAAVEGAGFTGVAFQLTEAVLAQWKVTLPQKVGASSLDALVTRRADGGFVALGSVTLAPGQHMDAEVLADLQALPGVHPGGWPYLRHSMEPLLEREIWRVCLPTAGIGLVLFFAVFRGVRERLAAILVLVASGLILLGMMSAFGWTWNLMSVGAVPLCLGLGLDFTIHMIHTLREDDATAARVAALGRSLAYCGLSTGLAFGALAMGSNKGLVSLGLITMTGVLTVLLTSAFALPYLWFRTGHGVK